jgi:hypothetical protein
VAIMSKEQKMTLYQTYQAQKVDEGEEAKASFWVAKLAKPGM